MTLIDDAGTWIAHLAPHVGSTALVSLTVFDASHPGDFPSQPNEIQAYVERRVGDVPFFRARLVRARFGLGNCRLVAADNFDIVRHIDVRPVPDGGSWRALRQELLRLRQSPLDLDQPPWHITVLTGIREAPGLESPGVGVVVRIDHAITDGAGSVAFARRLFAADPLGSGSCCPQLLGAEVQGSLSIADALTQVPRRLSTVVKCGIDAFRRSRDVTRDRTPARTVALPSTVLDHAGGPLDYRAVTVQLNDIATARAIASGATINDVMLAAIGGALRSYLEKFGVVPVEPLKVGVTIASAKRETSPLVGNDFTMGVVEVDVATPDPAQRLEAITSSMRRVKDQVKHGPKVSIERALQAVPPLFIPELLTRVAKKGGPGVNAAFVNVPRGKEPMYFGCARSVASFGLPFTHGVPVSHAASSLGEVMTLGVLFDSHALADPDFYLTALRSELHELTRRGTAVTAAGCADPEM